MTKSIWRALGLILFGISSVVGVIPLAYSRSLQDSGSGDSVQPGEQDVGVMTVARGTVTVNGNMAKAGRTILS